MLRLEDPKVTRLLWIAVCALALSACGPIDYLNTVTRRATRAVSDAKAANAEKLAPYEYWGAVTYLQMAREKVASADFEDAVGYGEKSETMAIKAKKLAADKGQEGPDARRSNQAPPEVITAPKATTPATKPPRSKAPAPKAPAAKTPAKVPAKPAPAASGKGGKQ